MCEQKGLPQNITSKFVAKVTKAYKNNHERKSMLNRPTCMKLQFALAQIEIWNNY